MKYKLTALAPDEARQASPGRFRVVTVGFAPQQVGEEVESIDEALAVRDDVSFQCDVKIVNDRGDEVSLPSESPHEQPGSMQAWGAGQAGSVCDSGFRISGR